MIQAAIVRQIRLLLEEGRLSQRQIARQVGVSHGTVNAIALGKRPDHPRRGDALAIASPGGPLERCPGCGGMVVMPCLACRIRAMRWQAVQKVRG